MIDRLGMILRDTQQLIRSVAVSLDTLDNDSPNPLVLQALLALLALRTGAPAAYLELDLHHDSVYAAWEVMGRIEGSKEVIEIEPQVRRVQEFSDVLRKFFYQRQCIFESCS